MKYAIRIPVRVAVVNETTAPSTWSWQDSHMTVHEEARSAKEAVEMAAKRLTAPHEDDPGRCLGCAMGMLKTGCPVHDPRPNNPNMCTYAVFMMYGVCEGPVTQRYGRKDTKAGDNDPHPFCDKHWAINQSKHVGHPDLQKETLHHLSDTACMGGWHLKPVPGESCPTCKGSGVRPGMAKDAAWYRSTLSERLSRWRDGDPRHRPTCDELADLLVDAIEALSVVTTDTTEGWDPLTDGPCPTHGNACTSDDGIICSGEKV